jgi:hypothetical protein
MTTTYLECGSKQVFSLFYRGVAFRLCRWNLSISSGPYAQVLLKEWIDFCEILGIGPLLIGKLPELHYTV